MGNQAVLAAIFDAKIDKLIQSSNQAASVLEAQAKRMADALNSVSKGVEINSKSIDKSLVSIRESSRKTADSVSGLGNMIKASFAFQATSGILAISSALEQIPSKIVKASEELTLFRTRLKNLYQDAQASGKGLSLALGSGLSIEDTGQLLSRFSVASDRLGTTSGDMADFTKAIVDFGRLGGNSIAEVTSRAVQLSQGLATGVLQGDELRAIFEGMPVLVQVIANHLKVPIGQIKQMAAEGKLSGRAVFDAIIEGANDPRYKKAIEELPKTQDQITATMNIQLALLGEQIEKTLHLGTAWGTVKQAIGDSADNLRLMMTGNQAQSEQDLVRNITRFNTGGQFTQNFINLQEQATRDMVAALQRSKGTRASLGGMFWDSKGLTEANLNPEQQRVLDKLITDLTSLGDRAKVLADSGAASKESMSALRTEFDKLVQTYNQMSQTGPLKGRLPDISKLESPFGFNTVAKLKEQSAKVYAVDHDAFRESQQIKVTAANKAFAEMERQSNETMEKMRKEAEKAFSGMKEAGLPQLQRELNRIEEARKEQIDRITKEQSKLGEGDFGAKALQKAIGEINAQATAARQAVISENDKKLQAFKDAQSEELTLARRDADIKREMAENEIKLDKLRADLARKQKERVAGQSADLRSGSGLNRNQILEMGKLAQSYGLRVSENSQFGGMNPGVHAANSLHKYDAAIDISGPQAAMDRFWSEQIQTRQSQMDMAIYKSMGVLGGQSHTFNARTQSKHQTHIHLAPMATGGGLGAPVDTSGTRGDIEGLERRNVALRHEMEITKQLASYAKEWEQRTGMKISQEDLRKEEARLRSTHEYIAAQEMSIQKAKEEAKAEEAKKQAQDRLIDSIRQAKQEAIDTARVREENIKKKDDEIRIEDMLVRAQIEEALGHQEVANQLKAEVETLKAATDEQHAYALAAAETEKVLNDLVASGKDGYKSLQDVPAELRQQLFDAKLEAARATTAAQNSVADNKDMLEKNKDLLNEIKGSYIDWSKEVAQAIQGSFDDFFFNAMQGKFDGLVASFKQTLDRMVSQALAAELMKALFGGTFGMTGGEMGGLLGMGMGLLGLGGSGASAAGSGMILTPFHTGGIVGEFGRPVKKFHSGGLASDEVPAILKENEGVFTQSQMKALGMFANGGNGNRTGGNVVVNMHINQPIDPAGFKQSRKQMIGEMQRQIINAQRIL